MDSSSNPNPYSYSLPGKALKLDSKQDIQPYLDEINKLEKLQEIHVGGHTLGVEACKALADVLRDKKELQVADFSDIFTGRLITEIPLALSALCDSLVDHKELVEINLSDNAFGGRSAEPMVNFLTHNHSFSILKLSNNGLGVSGGKIVAGALLSAAQELKEKNLTSNLKTIICGRNRLEDGSSDAWRQAFEAHGSLKEVRMYQNGIRMTGFENICKGLSECKELEIFDMQDNTATYRGAVAIAEAMKNWSNLKELNLNECIIRAKGAPLVFEQLQHTPLLEKFGLEYNGLKKEQVDILAGQVSSHLKNLTHLNVKANPTDEEDESIEKLREAMTKWGNEAGFEAEEMEDPEDEEDEDEDQHEEEEEEEDEAENIDSSSKEDQVEDSLAPALAATSISSPTPEPSEPAKSISSTPIINRTLDSTLETSASTPSDSIIEDQDPTTSKAIETNGTTIATSSNDSELSSNQPSTPSDASPDVEEEDLGAVEATSVVGGAALGATAALGALSLSDPPSSEDKQVEPQVSTPISAANTQESDLALETLPRSKIYTLPGKGLKLNTREDFAPYAKEIETIQDLEEIHVGGHTLGVGACQALADVLREKQSLKVADFADIFTGRLITEIPLALSALCDSLVDHKELVEINLSDNAFGGRSAEPMVNFLTHNHSFSILKLSNNGLGVSGGKIVAGALLSAAQELKEKNLTSNLKTIICGRNRLEDGSSDAWRQAFEAHGSLKEVRMYQNGIRMTGFENICKGLSECKELEIFDMQDNTATYRGAVAIAEAMKNWSNLKELNLNECIIRAKGAPLVFEQLQHTPLLEKFGLEYNGLKKEQVDILAGQVSSHLKNLTHLNVKANPTDEEDESIEKLREAMTKWGNEAGLEAEEMEDPEDEEDEDEDEDEEEEEEGEDVEEEKSEEANTSNNDYAPNTNPVTKDAEVTGAAVGAGAILAGSGSALLDPEKSLEINNSSRSIESEDQAPHSSQDPSPIPQAESVPQETAAIDSHADSLASETHPSIPENSTNTSVKEDVESASEKEEAVKSTELEQTINKQKDVLEKDQPLENAQPASAIGVLDSDKEMLTGQESHDHLQELEQEASQIKSSETNVSESDQAQAEEEARDQQEKEEAIKTTELEQVINKEKDSEEKNVPLEDAEPATAVGVLDSDAEVIQGKEPVDHVKELEQEATAAQGSSSTKETNDVSDSQDQSQSQFTPQPTVTETIESVGVVGAAGVAAVASSVAGAAFGSSKVKDETSREAPTSDSEKLQDAASSEKLVSEDNKTDFVQEIQSEEPVHQEEAPQQEQIGKTKTQEDTNSAAATEQVESQEPQSDSTPPNPTILESAQSLAVAGGAGIASLAASTSAAVSDLVSSSDKSKEVTEVEQTETVEIAEPSTSNDTGKSRAIEPSPSSSVINEAIERSNEIPTVDDPETLQKEQKKSKKRLFAPFTAAWEMLFSKAP